MTARHEGLMGLGRDIHAALPDVSEVERLRQRNAIVVLAEQPASTTRLGWRPALGIAALAAAVVVAVALWPAASSDDSPVPVAQVGDPVESPAPGGGGDLDVDASPRGEPHAPDAAGVKANVLVLAEGTLSLGRGQARRVAAGPYSIELNREGACELAWDPERQTLDLEVTDGEVVLHAPTSHHTIVAGDQARADPSEVVVSAVTRFVAPARNEAPAPRWRRLADEGHYKKAMARADTGGVFDRLRGLTRNDLKVLADVARLGGAPSKSGPIFLALRERFPRSREAERAAFYLGRQAERDGHTAKAVRWYREYLASSPKGSLSPEVRGRLLSVLAKRGETAQARTVAVEYLKRHPQGAYAGAAEKLVGP